MLNPTAYYSSQKDKLLKDFAATAKVLRPLLVDSLPGHDIDGLISVSHRNYSQLIPELPYIGGKQPFTRFIITAAMFLALYQALQPLGISLGDFGELVFRMGVAYLHAYPRFMLKVFGQMNFTHLYLARLRKRAAESQLSLYADDYVYTFVEGDGVNFDYGVDYQECGSCKFLARQGAPELAPYLCPADIIYSKALGWGLKRTTTLAEGGPCCDFRFKKGGITDVAVPESMRTIVLKVSL